MTSVVTIVHALSTSLPKSVARFVAALPVEFVAAWDLYARGDELSTAQARRPIIEGEEAPEFLLWSFAARGTKTYRAILFLASLGHGEQATMLVRSLYEDVLVAHWVDDHRDEAIARLERHERHNLHLWGETLRRRELDLGSLGELPPLTEGERRDFTRDFGRHGTRLWTGHDNLHALAKAVEKRWPDEQERQLFWHIHDIHLRHANLVLHNTSVGVVGPEIGEGSDRPAVYDAAESELDLAGALLGGFWSFAHLFRLVLTGDFRAEFEALYKRNMARFFSS